MMIKQNEINDDEIRIISSSHPELSHRKKKIFIFLIAIIAAILLCLTCILLLTGSNDCEEPLVNDVQEYTPDEQCIVVHQEPLPVIKGYTLALDTTVNRNGLLILSPVNARPRLIVGSESLNDSNIVLATQAADIRRDNGQIAGTFVLNGEVMSKGEAKAGFCSIINGDIAIGVADATPMLEQTLTEGGFFFRQYPLVVGGQLVENKPKGKAIRKALAEFGGKICVVMSKEKLTFHDFSQLLINAGARNAIYLVGSSSYGFYTTEKGDRIFTGKEPLKEVDNISYIVWEQR